MSKKPLVEDYQQQTPHMADAIAKATAIQDAEDAVVAELQARLAVPKKNNCHPGQAKREPGSFQTQVSVFYDPVSAGQRSALRRARDDDGAMYSFQQGPSSHERPKSHLSRRGTGFFLERGRFGW